MHIPNTTIRYCKIPGFRDYEINSFGFIRKVGTDEHIKAFIDKDTDEPRVTIVNNYGDIVNILVARLMLITFIGELELPIKYKQKKKKWDVSLSNISYEIPKYFKEGCSDESTVDMKLCGIRFRRINKLPLYFISETGMIYSTKRKKFNSISFDKDGYRFLSLFYITNRKKPFRIHRLVFETFEHEIKEGYVIDHFISDKNMNNIGNLSEMTVRENNIKAYQFDGKVIAHSKEEIRKIIEMRDNNKSTREIAKALGYNENNGENIIRSLLYAIDHNIAHFDLKK